MKAIIILLGVSCLSIVADGYSKRTSFEVSQSSSSSTSASGVVEISSSKHPHRKCKVVDGIKLFYNDKFVKILTPEERRELKLYNEKMEIWSIGFHENIARKLKKSLVDQMPHFDDMHMDLFPTSFSNHLEPDRMEHEFGSFVDIGAAAESARRPNFPSWMDEDKANLGITQYQPHFQKPRPSVSDNPEFPRPPDFCDY